jgi:NADH dehydrogenase/NADH:ubiquinone oxidoreductase subunit G
MTETAQRATLVLPAKGAFEKSGTTMNAGGDLLPVNASLSAPPFVRSDLEMLLALAEELDVSVPDSEELHRAVVANAAKTPTDFTLGDARFDSKSAAPSKAREAEAILSGGGTWLHDPWIKGMRS